MSSQSQNATTYRGYQASSALNYIPTRDSSDVTRMIRERVAYNENIWIAYSNGFRLSYLQGKLKCASCSGNALYGNGPYVNNVGGISAS